MTAPATPASPPVYLDYNATAPLRPEARDAVWEVLSGTAGNAGSAHSFGYHARDLVDGARRRLAEVLNCMPGEIIFTSGATEANNLALRAAVVGGRQLMVSAVEHPAVLETARAIDPTSPVVPVNRDGNLDIEGLQSLLRQRPHGSCVLSVMTANNETGVLIDLPTVSLLARQYGALLHTDATQCVGRLPVNVDDPAVDMLSLSAHKFGGPQGIGALFLRRTTPLQQTPLLHGGGQERGWRSGTLNVAGVVGLGAAAEAAARQLPEESVRVGGHRDYLEDVLRSTLDDIHVVGGTSRRLPGVSAVTFRGAPADAVLAAMPGVAASQGSACSRGAPEPSHVLLAMERSVDEAEQTVRFSLGHDTTRDDIDRACVNIVDAVHRVRRAVCRTAGLKALEVAGTQ